VVEWLKVVPTISFPAPPSWVERLPLFGSRLASLWRDIAAAGPAGLSGQIEPYLRTILTWFIAQVGSIGILLVQVLLTMVVSAILYSKGDLVADGVLRFGRRLAGENGEISLRLATQAIRAVALGVVVTALVQSVIGGIGLAITGVPFAALLSVGMFLLSIAQIGPLPVLIPSIFWVYHVHGVVWGVVLLVWAAFCGTFDNVLRPFLIRRGADLPLLLIFSGVIGGLIAFGVIGLFIGPVVLAVAYTLLADWVNEPEVAE
jgi:predicted PurR-regulated permease PerM